MLRMLRKMELFLTNCLFRQNKQIQIKKQPGLAQKNGYSCKTFVDILLDLGKAQFGSMRDWAFII